MRRGRGSGEGRKGEGGRQDWLRRGQNMRRGRGSGEGRKGGGGGGKAGCGEG